MLPEGIGVIDVLVIEADNKAAAPRLLVGEIKTYADRGGYTDSDGLATARAQAGVYVHALRLVIDDLGIAGRIEVADDGFLVLTLPGSNLPRVRAGESLELQAYRAERGFEQLRAAARELESFDVNDEDLGAGLVQATETHYDQTCLSFCDRAESCRKRAEEAGDPAILGEETARFLGNISVLRAVALLSGATADTEAEVDFVRRCEKMGEISLP